MSLNARPGHSVGPVSTKPEQNCICVYILYPYMHMSIECKMPLYDVCKYACIFIRVCSGGTVCVRRSEDDLQCTWLLSILFEMGGRGCWEFLGICLSLLSSSIAAMELQTHAMVSGFVWILGIWTQVLMIAWQTTLLTEPSFWSVLCWSHFLHSPYPCLDLCVRHLSRNVCVLHSHQLKVA